MWLKLYLEDCCEPCSAESHQTPGLLAMLSGHIVTECQEKGLLGP